MTASSLDNSLDDAVAGKPGEARPGVADAAKADPAKAESTKTESPEAESTERDSADAKPATTDAATSEEADDDADADDEAGSDEAGDEELFQQSEIAADYVEGLLDVLDMDGDIDELIANGRPMVEVVGGRLQSLVGPRGATLEALQDLARLAVFRRTGSPSRLLLDVGGYRATRRNELTAVARNAIERVREHGEPVKLEPMSAFERKCVHDVVNASEGVESESEGVEPNRRIVVRPT
jgi:spoIIIJ-associated protein